MIETFTVLQRHAVDAKIAGKTMALKVLASGR